MSYGASRGSAGAGSVDKSIGMQPTSIGSGLGRSQLRLQRCCYGKAVRRIGDGIAFNKRGRVDTGADARQRHSGRTVEGNRGVFVGNPRNPVFTRFWEYAGAVSIGGDLAIVACPVSRGTNGEDVANAI